MTTKAQALDHLTDVLAGEDVSGEPTVAGAIDKLATMIEDGEITIGGELPTASADTLGGVKVGSGLSITEAGVLSASGGSGTVVKVQFDPDLEHQGGLICTKTSAELIDMLENGDYVIGVIYDGQMIMPVTGYDKQNNNVFFTAVGVESTGYSTTGTQATSAWIRNILVHNDSTKIAYYTMD